MSKSKNWVVGRWLIESMDQWDRDFIDEKVRGYFEFDDRGLGSFQFGYVQGQIDYRLGERDGNRRDRHGCPPQAGPQMSTSHGDLNPQ